MSGEVAKPETPQRQSATPGEGAGRKKKRAKERAEREKRDEEAAAAAAAAAEGKGEEGEPAAPTDRGSGTYVYPDGSRYEGEWMIFVPEAVREALAAKETTKRGKDKNKVEEPPLEEIGIVKRHGTGVFTDRDQSYSGEWVEDEMHGQGTFTYASGAVYNGTWGKNHYQGQGKYTWPDGSFYEGEWRDDKMHGLGRFTDVSGQTWVGQFYNGVGNQLVNVIDAEKAAEE